MGKLSDAKLRGIKPTATIRKYTDGDGLFLKVTPNGGMYWQWRIKTPTGETTVTYGSYPKVGLAEARRRHREAQEQRRAEVVNPNVLDGRINFLINVRATVLECELLVGQRPIFNPWRDFGFVA